MAAEIEQRGCDPFIIRKFTESKVDFLISAFRLTKTRRYLRASASSSVVEKSDFTPAISLNPHKNQQKPTRIPLTRGPGVVKRVAGPVSASFLTSVTLVKDVAKVEGRVRHPICPHPVLETRHPPPSVHLSSQGVGAVRGAVGVVGVPGRVGWKAEEGVCGGSAGKGAGWIIELAPLLDHPPSISVPGKATRGD